MAQIDAAYKLLTRAGVQFDRNFMDCTVRLSYAGRSVVISEELLDDNANVHTIGPLLQSLLAGNHRHNRRGVRRGARTRACSERGA